MILEILLPLPINDKTFFYKEKLKSGKIEHLPNSYHSENLWQYEPFADFMNFIMQQTLNPDKKFLRIIEKELHVYFERKFILLMISSLKK